MRLVDVASAAEASALADRTLSSITSPIALTGDANGGVGPEVVVTASIGVALVEHGTERTHEALRRADDAVYRAKSNGRNQVTQSFTGDHPAASTVGDELVRT